MMSTLRLRHPECRVSGCALPLTHVTAGHVCEECGERGHGALECGSAMRKAFLFFQYGSERMPLPCPIPGCLSPWTHSGRYHTTVMPQEPLSLVGEGKKLRCPICRIESFLPATPEGQSLVFVDASCIVCLEAEPLVIFPVCRHAYMCSACLKKSM